MKRTLAVTTVLAATMLTSCVSKKKYVALEDDYNSARSNLQQTQMEKEQLEERLGAIEERVADYNARINSLRDENNEKLEMNDLTAMSNANKENMRRTLQKVDQEKLREAKTLEDSINLAVSYNLGQQISGEVGDDINISVDKTVVMIDVSDKLLFRSGSHRVSRDAYPLLEKLAEVINSEPTMEVMVEGHTDSQTMVENSYLQDNWDLSVRRATAIVRLLQDRYDVNPEKLIAAGRSSYDPVADNDSAENRAKNRRTRIVVIPNLDKFLAMLDSEG
ncbi:flagellar motor protein MotB [Salinimicrobium marinum]|uniref:Flagellar motor protein MotB n=1 Tax=Salinimicrobium marinum TaxID=680283 RepID=A0A918VWE9_9FLAO|nr:OmpA family protein [Salinimicrobium marinum]GHA31074.1 flagellar motor protein MotB [Salinimicrobium marinum]